MHEEVSCSNPRKSRWWHVATGFFVCGVLNNVTYVVMLSAAKDILHDSLVTYVLLADDAPALFAQFVSPFFLGVSFRVRAVAIVVLNVVALVAVTSPSMASYRLLAVMIASFAFGLGESTFFSLLSHFDSTAISAFSSGTGGAGIVGAILQNPITHTSPNRNLSGAGVYYFMRSVMGVSWQTTLRALALVCTRSPKPKLRPSRTLTQPRHLYHAQHALILLLT